MSIPSRDPNPPVRWVQIPVCPECGCDELGEIRMEKTYNRIVSWDFTLGKPTVDAIELEDGKFVDWADPHYYCCGCGLEFNHFEIIEEAR